MELDKTGALQNKLFDLKKYRDTLQQEAAVGASELTQLEEQLNHLQNAVDMRKRESSERQAKLKRIEVIISESEHALRKLAENAKRLEGVIEHELSSSIGKK